MNFPYCTAIDASGNVYIADAGDNRVRKLSVEGIISTIAGNGTIGYNGDNIAATAAELNEPVDVAVDGVGNVYIADNSNHRVRMVNSAGIITTIAGTGDFGYNGDGIPASTAKLFSPHGIRIDGSGNLLICDALNNRIRKVSPAVGGIISTIAGNGTGGYSGDGGPATSKEIARPYGITVDVTGNIYIADLNNRIRKVDPSGIISTIAGTGTAGYNGDNILATSAELNQPFGVAVDNMGSIYVADVANSRIRKVNSAGIISTYAGTGAVGFSGDYGLANMAELHNPVAVSVDVNGNIFIADWGNLRIRYIKSTLSVNALNTRTETINIFPNPSTTGSFTVNIIAPTNNEVQVVITNILGEKLKEITALTNRPTELYLDAPTGIYLLSAITPHGKYTQKIVLEK